MSIEVVCCQSGVKRHDPELHERVIDAGCTFRTVECFDRCETCERFLLARIDGTMTRFPDSAALVEALDALLAPEGK